LIYWNTKRIRIDKGGSLSLKRIGWGGEKEHSGNTVGRKVNEEESVLSFNSLRGKGKEKESRGGFSRKEGGRTKGKLSKHTGGIGEKGREGLATILKETQIGEI